MVAQTVDLPNIKKLFLPDPGFILGDADLKQADAQVVAWEANDDELKAIFRDASADLHIENAKTIFGHCTPKLRQRAKAGVHAVNYGVRARTLAIALGITVREAEDFIRKWFSAHPGIADWHERIEDSIHSTRAVTNAFGYRRQYFDRIDSVFNQALAWIPQSTVALVIAKAIIDLDTREQQGLSDVQVLMQVHDSIISQWPKATTTQSLLHIKDSMEVEIPYEDPLIIPVDIATSSRSWGDCEAVEWPQAA